MMFATVEAIPFMITLNRFALDDAVAELMILEVAEIPLVELVITFPVDDNVFEVTTDVVPIDPPMFEVNTFPDTD
jgi:hypothetical protein